MSKKPFPTPQAPREIAEIQRDYNQAAAEAGNYQYQIKVIKERLNEVNDRMKAIQAEGDARHKLNQEVLAETTKQEAPVESPKA